MPPETDNLQLEDLFDADQEDRDKVYETPEAVRALQERDRARRKRVRVMLELDEVRTKNDLYHAALVLQHGEDPADFLAAHRLAAVGAVMGHKTCRWLMAASLDRYLMAIGLGQVYGTQFEYNPEDKRYQMRLPTQEQTLLSFEKEFLGVPSTAARLKELNDKIKAK